MYRELFRRVLSLVMQPGKEWPALVKREERGDEFLVRYVYPLIGLVAAAAFLGRLFTERTFSVELALKSSIKSLISVYGGFYLSSYILHEAWKGVLCRPSDVKRCQRFVAYGSALCFALRIVMPFLSIPVFFERVLSLYTVYIVWEGAGPYMLVEEKTRMRFVLLASGLIIFVPVVIEVLLFMLMPGMRI